MNDTPLKELSASLDKCTLLYTCLVGSQAYGLESPDSDEDVRGVYQYDLHSYLGLGGFPGENSLPGVLTNREAGNDAEMWELGHFVRLALKGNPATLEVLYAPTFVCYSDLMHELRDNRQRFLSERAARAFLGFIKGQFIRAERKTKDGGELNYKNLMHGVRVSLMLRELLKTGDFPVVVYPAWVKLLRGIREQKYSLEEILCTQKYIMSSIEEKLPKGALPLEPDHEWANDFLVRARLSSK